MMVTRWLVYVVGVSAWEGRCVGCLEDWRGDGVCDLPCMLSPCNWDSPASLSQSDCYLSCLSTGCSAPQLSNGRCDTTCNSAVCAWDAGDCGVCAAGCK